MRVLLAILSYVGLLGYVAGPLLIVEWRGVRRERKALRAATLEMLFRVRCLPPVPRGPEDRPADARGDQ